ncbi:hypothetical protein [Tenacibaculum geojense]|uniref:Uncharacterized protein n=1 Tax=Tenacibaculum geojense TaxID=915352 RepID=A0ABW3JQT7_9FLAO
MKLFKKLVNSKKIKIDEEQKKVLLEESTISEAEKALEKLKEEEEEVRNQVKSNLKEIFKDLPILL